MRSIINYEINTLIAMGVTGDRHLIILIAPRGFILVAGKVERYLSYRFSAAGHALCVFHFIK